MHDSSLTNPPWIDGPPPPLLPLRHDATADVCVIGAGISGLSVAYELTQRGASVVVVDQNAIGHGQTCNTTAHLVTALDERYFELERLHGRHGSALTRLAHAAAIERIESIVRTEAIDCSFARLDGYIFVPLSRSDPVELLHRELAAATRAQAVAEILPTTPGLAVQTPCLRFPRQAQFHPLRYIEGLARAIRDHRGRIFTGTRVTSVDAGERIVVQTQDHFTVSAGAAVVATNRPIRERTDTLPAQTPFRSFVIALKLPAGAVPPSLYWDGYWDDDTPYHYVRVAHATDGHDLLIVGGEDEEITDPAVLLTPDDLAARACRLQEWARLHFPMVGEVTHRWHGCILEPDDELAFIGRLNDHDRNVYIVSGDSGNGMTYAAIAGMILPELIAGRDHPWAAIYSPMRKRLDTPTRRSLACEKAGNR